MSADPPETRRLHETLRDAKARAREEVEGADPLAESLASRGELVEEIDIDESGPAGQYLETFKKSEKLEVFVMYMQQAMNNREADPLYNFENWLTMEPDAMTDFLQTYPHIPRGKGRLALIEGLEADRESDEWKKSYEVLRGLVAFQRQLFEERRHAQEDTEKQTKGAEGPIESTIGTGVKNIMRNFKGAKPLEKLLLLAAGAIGIGILWRVKDERVWFTKETKWSTVFLGLGALWGVNHLSGKMASDGKTLVQRMDLFRDVDQMDDENVLRAFAEDHGLAEDQNKLRAFYLLQKQDARKLFRLYEEAEGPTGSRRIDPKKLGFYHDEIDGKDLYDIVDELVKMTAVNEETQRRRKYAEDHDEEYARPTEDDIAAWTEPGYARRIFRKKYFEGPLGNVKVTLFDAIMNEYHTYSIQESIREGKDMSFMWRESIKAGEARRFPDRTGASVKKHGEAAWRGTKNWAKSEKEWGGKWIIDQTVDKAGKAGDAAEKFWDFSKENALKPLWEGAKNVWGGIALPKMKKGPAFVQEKWWNQVMDRDAMNFEVVEPNVASIRGVHVPFEISYTKGTAKIEGIEFNTDVGVSGNSTKALQLETKIDAKMAALINSKNIPQLRGKRPVWNATEKKWEIANVSVNGHSALGIPAGTATVFCKVLEDGSTLEFYVGETKIDNFGELDEFHAQSKILEAMWAQNPGLQRFLEDLPKTAIDPTALKGTLGGLDITMKKKAGPGGALAFDYADPNSLASRGPVTWFTTGGLENVPISPVNEGPKFLENLTDKLMSEPRMRDTFLTLESQIDNTGDDFSSRIGELMKTKKLWIIPTNVQGAINGRVLQERFRATLRFKMDEVRLNFQDELIGKTLNDIPTAYAKHMDTARTELNALWHTINGLNEEQRAQNFGALMDTLEQVNYSNPDYVMVFEELQRDIERYNFEGIDSLDLGTAEKANEIYHLILLVWSSNTRDKMNAPMLSSTAGLSTTDIGILRYIKTKIVQKLDLAAAGDKTVSKDELPNGGKADESQFHLWLT